MASEKHTPNLGLTQYSNNGTDSVSFMGDYNQDMKIIDLKYKALEDKINQIIDMLNVPKENQHA